MWTNCLKGTRCAAWFHANNCPCTQGLILSNTNSSIHVLDVVFCTTLAQLSLILQTAHTSIPSYIKMLFPLCRRWFCRTDSKTAWLFTVSQKDIFSCLYYSKVLRTSSASQWFEWIAMGMESEQDGKVLATWITLNHSIEDTVISYRCLARGISSSYKKSCWRLLGDRDQRKNNNLKRDASEDRYPQNQWP